MVARVCTLYGRQEDQGLAVGGGGEILEGQEFPPGGAVADKSHNRSGYKARL